MFIYRFIRTNRSIGQYVLSFFEFVGNAAVFVFSAVKGIFVPPFYFRMIFASFIEIGFYSLPVVGMTAIFTGAVLVLQSYVGFSRFSAESSIPMVVVLSITRELGPVLAGLMVTGRIGASIAAEIATMQVTEQIDALRTLAVSPIKYLVTPRIIASVLMMPILVIIADIIGIMGGYIVATEKLGFNKGLYLSNTFNYLETEDVVSGLSKAAIFGFLIAFSGCYNGYIAGKGAAGVGKATTNAVVMASVLILLFNYFTTELFFSK
jgi:phospholipid/cholesterol/gamma-HCH transport system permease protein